MIMTNLDSTDHSSIRSRIDPTPWQGRGQTVQYDCIINKVYKPSIKQNDVIMDKTERLLYQALAMRRNCSAN